MSALLVESRPITSSTTESFTSSTAESLPTESTSTPSLVAIVTQTQVDRTFSTSTSSTTSPSPTSSSTYNASNTTSTSSQANSAGLSVGESVGTGVGVALGVLLLALGAFLLYRYNRKRRTFAQEDNGGKSAFPELPELGIDGQKYELPAEDSRKPAELAGDRPKNTQTRRHTHELD